MFISGQTLFLSILALGTNCLGLLHTGQPASLTIKQPLTTSAFPQGYNWGEINASSFFQLCVDQLWSPDFPHSTYTRIRTGRMGLWNISSQILTCVISFRLGISVRRTDKNGHELFDTGCTRRDTRVVSWVRQIITSKFFFHRLFGHDLCLTLLKAAEPSIQNTRGTPAHNI